MTLDGVGEWTTAAFGVGEGNRIRLIDHVAFPHSLGLLYSAFTYYCGFKVNSGEYKLMGLAPYGRPIYRGADPGARWSTSSPTAASGWTWTISATARG